MTVLSARVEARLFMCSNGTQCFLVSCLSFFTLSFFCDTEMRKQAAKKENTGNK